MLLKRPCQSNMGKDQEGKAAPHQADMAHSRQPLQELHGAAVYGLSLAHPAKPLSMHTLCDTNQGELDEVADALLQLKVSGQTAADPSGRPAKAARDDCELGFFDNVPDSWLYQFIMSCPNSSRRALFASSWSLARSVVSAVDEVTLILPACACTPADHTEARRGIIARILEQKEKFAVQVWPAPWQPFPTQLSSQVTSVSADARDGFVADCCTWGTLTSLEKVSLVNTHEVTLLCLAVGEGQLKQLRSLQLLSSLSLLPDQINHIKGTLGLQLQDLRTNLTGCIRHVGMLHVLQSLDISDCELSGKAMRKLCGHRTLRHVTLRQCKVRGDHSGRNCHWESLTIHSAELHQLLHLPLASAQQVCLVGSLSAVRADDEPVEANALAQYTDKMTCQAGEFGEFSFIGAHDAMVPLLGRFDPKVKVETLALALAMSHASVLPLLWQNLPQSVTRITLWKVTGVSWADLWKGLPQHVVHATLSACSISVADLCTLVQSVPLHVGTLALRLRHAQHDAHTVSLLQAKAPKHLRFDLTGH